MFLQESSTGHLVEVLTVQDLMDPFCDILIGRYNIGEELPDPAKFPKSGLIFPSGEALPQCWLDSHYREHMKK